MRCEVLSSTATEIKCRTGPGPSEGENSIYQGADLEAKSCGKGFYCVSYGHMGERN